MKKCREKVAFTDACMVSLRKIRRKLFVSSWFAAPLSSVCFSSTWIRAVDDELAEPNYNDFGNWAALPQKKMEPIM